MIIWILAFALSTAFAVGFFTGRDERQGQLEDKISKLHHKLAVSECVIESLTREVMPYRMAARLAAHNDRLPVLTYEDLLKPKPKLATADGVKVS